MSLFVSDPTSYPCGTKVLTRTELQEFDRRRRKGPNNDVVAGCFPVAGGDRPETYPVGVFWIETLNDDAGFLLATFTNDQAVNFDQMFGDGCLRRALPVESDTPVLDILESDDRRGRQGDSKKVPQIVR